MVVMDTTNQHGGLHGVVVVGASAGRVEAVSNCQIGTGLLYRHYSPLTAESERALTVVSDRLSTNAPRPGGPSG